MSVVTGVFHTIEGAEDTTKALLDAGFTDDDIGVIVRDDQKGPTIADDIGREYASGATPEKTGVMDRSSVWDRIPDGFDDLMHREGLPDDAVTWYQQRLDEGDVLMVINASDRLDDTMRIVREHDGALYGRHGAMMQQAEGGEVVLEPTAEEMPPHLREDWGDRPHAT